MNPDRARTLVWTWIALLALLAISCASSFVSMGWANVVVNLGVAALKALLVALVFMRLRKGGPMIRVAAAAGVLWLSILVGLSVLDFAFRIG